MRGLSETIDPPSKPEERLRLLHEPLEQGPTIIYVPTRKETLKIAKFLCGFGVKAAAYNASVFFDNYYKFIYMHCILEFIPNLLASVVT